MAFKIKYLIPVLLFTLSCHEKRTANSSNQGRIKLEIKKDNKKHGEQNISKKVENTKSNNKEQKLLKATEPARKLTPEEEQLETVLISLNTLDAKDFLSLIEENAPGFKKRVKNQKIYPLAKIRKITIGDDFTKGALVELKCVKKNTIPKECAEDAVSPPANCEKIKKYIPCEKKFKPQHLALYLKRIKGEPRLVLVAEPVKTSAFEGDELSSSTAEKTILFDTLGIFKIDIKIMDETDPAKTPTGETKTENKIEFFSVSEQGLFRHLEIEGDGSYSWFGTRTSRDVKTTFVSSTDGKRHYLVIEVISKKEQKNTDGDSEDPQIFCSRKTDVYIIKPQVVYWKKVSAKALKVLTQKEKKIKQVVDDDLTEKGKGSSCPTIL